MKTTLHLGLNHTDQDGNRVACFQLLNDERKAVATATFRGSAVESQLFSPSLSSLECTLFLADCRNTIHSAVNWDAVLEQSEKLVQDQKWAKEHGRRTETYMAVHFPDVV